MFCVTLDLKLGDKQTMISYVLLNQNNSLMLKHMVNKSRGRLMNQMTRSIQLNTRRKLILLYKIISQRIGKLVRKFECDICINMCHTDISCIIIGNSDLSNAFCQYFLVFVCVKNHSIYVHILCDMHVASQYLSRT